MSGFWMSDHGTLPARYVIKRRALLLVSLRETELLRIRQQGVAKESNASTMCALTQAQRVTIYGIYIGNDRVATLTTADVFPFVPPMIASPATQFPPRLNTDPSRS